MARAASKVLAILVTYKPDLDILRTLLAPALEQADRLVVVDNLSTPQTRQVIWEAAGSGRPGESPPPNMELIPNAANAGLGVGFNQGIVRAMELGFDFVLLLDQDSILRPGAIRRLVDEFHALSTRFEVGALQAANLEADGRVNFDSRRRDYYRRRGMYEGETSYQGLYLLNSGAFFPVDVFRKVGLLDERYFIVFVDYEIALRLARAGLGMFHVPGAKIDHNVGPKPRPDPKRLYHAVRELVLLIATYSRGAPERVFPVVWTTSSRVASMTLRSGRPVEVLAMSLRGLFEGILELGPEPRGVAHMERG
jgi:rhamnosyltransferase